MSSDSVSSGKKDKAGKIIASKLNTLGLDVSDYTIVPDEIEKLQNTVLQFCEKIKIWLL